MLNQSTVVPGFRVLGFSVLPGFRALKAGDGAWSVHKTLFGFRALLTQCSTLTKFRFFTVKCPCKGSKLLKEYFFVVFSSPEPF